VVSGTRVVDGSAAIALGGSYGTGSLIYQHGCECWKHDL
jgi:hypothetical protein